MEPMPSYPRLKKVALKSFAIPPKTSPKHGSISPPSVSFGGVLRTTIREVMENKYWHNVPEEDEEEEEERCAMTLAKAKREEELLEECADE